MVCPSWYAFILAKNKIQVNRLELKFAAISTFRQNAVKFVINFRNSIACLRLFAGCDTLLIERQG